MRAPAYRGCWTTELTTVFVVISLAACGAPSADASGPEAPPEDVVRPESELESAYARWFDEHVRTMPDPHADPRATVVTDDGYGRRFNGLGRLGPRRAFTHGDLDASILESVARQQTPQLVSCYEPLLPDHPSLIGRLVMRFRIEPDGTLSAAEAVDGTTLAHPQLIECAVRSTSAWRLPAAPGRPPVPAAFAVNFSVVGNIGR